jgi:protein-S-isoprenylcysteine O-methyltransferase Ste14
VIAGFLATLLVFRENSIAAPVVRVQAERAQRVIDTGPYSVVRHPMYASAVPCLLGMPLLLGSWYGLLVVPLMLLNGSPSGSRLGSRPARQEEVT